MAIAPLTLVGICSFVTAFLLTYQLRRVALRRNIMDIPNARSSHNIATPRGGGLSFVIVTILMTAISGYMGWIDPMTALAVCCGGICVAGIGFVDDILSLSALTRLLFHLAASIILVVVFGVINPLPFFNMSIPLWIFAYPFTVLLTIWLINLSNFMDGINGIASTQAITVCLIGFIVGVNIDNTGLAQLSLIFGAATLGFMLWNFPKGFIFMGDAGSGFIGFMAMSLILAPSWNPATGSAILIMLSLFLTDSTLTLLLRLKRGERIFQPHRSHLYQELAQYYASHTPVTLAYLAVQICVMAPLAIWASGATSPGTPLGISYLITIISWFVLRPIIVSKVQNK